ARTTLLPNVIAKIERETLIAISGKARMRKRVNRALGILKAFTLCIGDIQLKIDVETVSGIADSGDFQEDLKDLLVEVGEVAREAKTGLLIQLDELQLLEATEYAALIVALHRINQKQLPVAFIGAGLPMLPALTGEAKSYAERMFFYALIGSLAP